MGLRRVGGGRKGKYVGGSSVISVRCSMVKLGRLYLYYGKRILREKLEGFINELDNNLGDLGDLGDK